MVRVREELAESSSDPSSVSRLRVWVKSHTKKDGTPVNENAAEMIVRNMFIFFNYISHWIVGCVYFFGILFLEKGIRIRNNWS